MPSRRYVWLPSVITSAPAASSLSASFARDAGAVGDVLAVDDADVCAELVAQAGQAFFDRAPAGDAEDIREEEESQFRTSVAAGRSSIETWLPASFV